MEEEKMLVPSGLKTVDGKDIMCYTGAFYLKNEEKIKRIIKKCEEILDAESEEKVMSILKDISNKGKCVIMVTHNTDLIKYADKVYNLENGVLNEK